MDAAATSRRRFDPVAYLKLFRAPLVFTAIADAAAGSILASGPRELRPRTLVLAGATSAGLYFFGMALNDIADYRKDLVGAPGRVLPSGRLSMGAAWRAALGALLGSGVALLGAQETPVLQRLLFWFLVVVSIVAYDVVLKAPPIMGLVRAFNLLLGASMTLPLQDPWSQRPWSFGVVALPALVYVSALTYVSTLEEGVPDRSRLAWGAGGMVLGALLAAFLDVLGEAIKQWPFGFPVIRSPEPSWEAALIALALSAWVTGRAWRARDRKGMMLLVRDGVGGIILLDAAIVTCGTRPEFGLALASLILPAALSVAVMKKLA